MHARQNAPAAERAEQVARVHRDGGTCVDCPTRAARLRAGGSDVVARLERLRRRHVRRPMRSRNPAAGPETRISEINTNNRCHRYSFVGSPPQSSPTVSDTV